MQSLVLIINAECLPVGSFIVREVCVENKEKFVFCSSQLISGKNFRVPSWWFKGFKHFFQFKFIHQFSLLVQNKVKSVATDLYWSISKVFSNSPFTTMFTVSVNSFLKCMPVKPCQLFSNSHNLHPLPNQVTNQSRFRYIPVYTPPYLYGSLGRYTWIPCQRRQSCSNSYSLLSQNLVEVP